MQQESKKLQQDTPVTVQLLQDKVTLLEQQNSGFKGKFDETSEFSAFSRVFLKAKSR